MTTQLRLVEPPEPTTAPSPRRTGAGTTTRRATPGRTRARRTAGPARRAVSFGEWRLDPGTREVGRAGVAQARKALEAALAQQLSEAS